MKIDLKKSGGDFLSVNTFPPKLKSLVLDLSVLHPSAHLELAHSQHQKVGVGTSPTQERNHIMYQTSTHRIGIGWEVSLIPIHVN